MTLTLGPDAQKLIAERMKRGGYASPEEVVLAALASLEREENYGDFAPGEMNALIAEGERSGEPLDWEQVLSELRDLRSGKTSE